MEQTDFKAKLKRRLVIYTALGLLLYGGFAYFLNPYARIVAERADSAVNILVVTNPPMFISYNPKHRKAMVTNIELNKKGLKTEDVLKDAGINPGGVIFVKPSTVSRAEYWDDFKTNLRVWRNKPYILFEYLYAYAKLRLTDKTNLAVSDFLLLSLDLMQLTPPDFSVKNPDKPARKNQPAPKQEILIAQNIAPAKETQKAIVLEILNASGQAGLAADITRYLRELSNNNILNVDVINYANYPAIEEKSKIIDITGRFDELKKIGHYLGLENNEIFTAFDKTAISDAKIIIGRDFDISKTR